MTKNVNVKLNLTCIRRNHQFTNDELLILAQQKKYLASVISLSLEEYSNLLHNQFRGWTFNKPGLYDKESILDEAKKLLASINAEEDETKEALVYPISLQISNGSAVLYVVQELWLKNEKQDSKKMMFRVSVAYTWIKQNEMDEWLLLSAAGQTLPLSCKSLVYFASQGEIMDLVF